MLSSLTIKNFKSIVDLTLELGRFNVFIGENGCGKTNILEALGMVAAADSSRLGIEDLSQRGLRVARPSLMTSAFAYRALNDTVELSVNSPIVGRAAPGVGQYRLDARSGNWIERRSEWVARKIAEATERNPGSAEDRRKANEVDEAFVKRIMESWGGLAAQMSDDDTSLADMVAAVDRLTLLGPYSIFCADTLALRGLQPQSLKTPLGLYGEGLDVAIAQLPSELRAKLVEHAKVVSWLEDIDLDAKGTYKLEGHKLGRSVSDLYFLDRFMSPDNKLFSAENANEGILHVLFYLVLFMHPGTPKLFAIDNIESSLNPHLLRHLVKTLAGLAKEHDRQALVTTHNPAALDGLNLHDDEQRLFVVSRNDEGHTQAERITIKPEHEVGGLKLKLSELWMRGMLGGIPTHF